MLGGVFISYRREDSGGFAGRIYDRLTSRLGRDSVFFDVDNIPAGLDFVDILSERVGKCDALVAVIGRAWNPVGGKENRPRLDDPNDFVRVEIEAALARGIRVIPVLVDGAAMPRAEDLPECLKKLVRRQGIEISHTRFHSDVERLARALSLLEDELRQREAAEAERAVREERERREAAEAAEKAEQARRLAEAEARREEEARRASEAAEAERAARVEREKREAAEKAEREKLRAEAAERARQLAEAEAQRQDEERRAREAAEAERAGREEREKREAAEKAEREWLRAEAEATIAAREAGAATAKWTGDIANAVLKTSQGDAPDRALAAAARRRDGRNWPIPAAVVGAAILGTVLLIAEFGSRHGNTPAVESNASTAQPRNAIAAAPAVAPPPEAAAPSETVAPAALSNPVAAPPALAPTPKAVVQPEPTATPEPPSSAIAAATAVPPAPNAAAHSEPTAPSAAPNAPEIGTQRPGPSSQETTPAPARMPPASPEESKPSSEVPPPTQSGAPDSPAPPSTLALAPIPAAPKPAPSRIVPVETLTPQREQELQAKDVFKDCAECPEMVVIPSGAFTMGSSATDIQKGDAFPNEGPQHRVFIHERFALARHEVTRDEFEAFVAASGRRIVESCYTLEDGKPQERDGRSFLNPGFAQAGDHPAVCVSWLDATDYAEWLFRTTGKTYRLPSEAEYEYAARAGSELRFGSADDATDLCRFVNGADQSAKQAGLPSNLNFLDCTDGYPYTAPVGAFTPNAFGLFDLLGNVWEWTAECHHEHYRTASSDGAARTANLCVERAVRGGSWSSPAVLLRPAVRTKAKVNNRFDDVGFRVVRELEP